MIATSCTQKRSDSPRINQNKNIDNIENKMKNIIITLVLGGVFVALRGLLKGSCKYNHDI